jgi:hypothetical protein
VAKQLLGPLTKITVNGTDLSQWAHSITLEDSANQVDVTGFGETYSEFIQGQKTAQITASFWQDYASGGPDATLSPLYYNNGAGTVKVTPDTSGTVVYTMVSKLEGWSPASGGVGDANSIDVTFSNFGTLGLTRGTS